MLFHAIPRGTKPCLMHEVLRQPLFYLKGNFSFRCSNAMTTVNIISIWPRKCKYQGNIKKMQISRKCKYQTSSNEPGFLVKTVIWWSFHVVALQSMVQKCSTSKCVCGAIIVPRYFSHVSLSWRICCCCSRHLIYYIFPTLKVQPLFYFS